jgi:hypothetical protein
MSRQILFFLINRYFFYIVLRNSLNAGLNMFLVQVIYTYNSNMINRCWFKNARENRSDEIS